MGAPGYAHFCGRGHLVNWWDEHLYWTNEMFKAKEKSKEAGCICGNKDILEISHYGGINDCICLDEEQNEKGIRLTGKSDEVIVPIEDAIDKNGITMVGCYRKVRLEIYLIPENVRDGSIWKTP